KNGDITEDDLRSQTEDVQKATDNSIKEIDQLVEDKEKRHYVCLISSTIN
ncbi:ribosome recycling factor, partial [Staphylococcus aureus]